MNRRLRAMIVALALLSIAVLLFRPVTLQALGSPYGSHFSPDVELTKAEGSPHCSLLADCETISISNVGLDFDRTGIVILLAGLVVALAVAPRLAGRSWIVLVPNRPPLAAS